MAFSPVATLPPYESAEHVQVLDQDDTPAVHDELLTTVAARQRYSSLRVSVVGCAWQVSTTPAVSSSGSRA